MIELYLILANILSSKSYPLIKFRITEIGMILLLLLPIFIVGISFTNNNNDTILYAKNGAFRNNTIENNTINYMQNHGINSNEVVILTFGDIHKSQFTTAKPILDQYNFKASFFVPCGMVGESSHMDWKEIQTLYSEGNDIQAKSDKNLIGLAPSNLDFQISQPKKCLSEHGIDPSTVTTFAVRHGNAVLNSTVINTVAKYYDMAINGFSSLMRLNCSGYKDLKSQGQETTKGRFAALIASPNHQTDCRTYTDDGRITEANRYSIREWNHNGQDMKFNYNSIAILSEFVQVVNSQSKYNTGGMINAIPLIAYHSIDDNRTRSSTDVNLFAAEMKYLYEHGFKIITMKDLGYDEMSNHLYVKNMA